MRIVLDNDTRNFLWLDFSHLCVSVDFDYETPKKFIKKDKNKKKNNQWSISVDILDVCVLQILN